VFWEEGGTEARIFKDGDLLVGRRFEEGWKTLEWAEAEKRFIENGGANHAYPRAVAPNVILHRRRFEPPIELPRRTG
jgi:hypothetical protein